MKVTAQELRLTESLRFIRRLQTTSIPPIIYHQKDKDPI